MSLKPSLLVALGTCLPLFLHACGEDGAEPHPTDLVEAGAPPLGLPDGGAVDASFNDSGAPGADAARDDAAQVIDPLDGSSEAGGPPPGPVFADPGTGPWQRVPESEVAAACRLDPALLKTANTQINTPYAIVRYGKLCHEYIPSGSDGSAEVWSATKTLGALVTGIASYETRNIARTGPKTGQLKDSDRADHWLDANSITFNREAHLAHMLAMVGHSQNLSNLTYAYDTIGSTQINRLSDVVNTAIKQDAARLGANIEQFTKRYLFDAVGMTGSTWSGGAVNKNYAYSWNATLHDMARVGLLILHRGNWNGKRVLDESWIHRMTHPAFEQANTAYGYLTWLNARSGATGPGGAGTGVGGDRCAPAAVWQDYPHGLSKASSCLYTSPHSCEQQFDVGVWSAQGLGGQFIVGHPGLDLVIVAKNYNGGGPAGLWQRIRPALVKLDPTYKGDESAFCTAYGANDYAPDLVGEVMQPAD